MLKKIIIFCLPLFLGAAGANASAMAPQPDPTETQEMVGEQYVSEPQTPPSEQVNYVEESEMARKMMQAKKAHDAATYDSFGGGITIIAMCIVIGALIVLSILFYVFGNISSWVLTRRKKKTVKGRTDAGQGDTEVVGPDSGVVIAAISAALAQHFAVDHDMQDTILTIRKLRKAYSPWNSKIYNMRQLPELPHTHVKLGDR